MSDAWIYTLVFFAWLAGAAAFVLGLHQMNSPATARRGNQLSAAGMALAVIVTFLWLLPPGNAIHSGGMNVTAIAIIVAEVVIATPVILGLSAAGIGQLDPRLQVQLQGLGASRYQTVWWLWREARLSLLAALMAGFGSVISEVGAAMMVGGNISGQTRVLTTAIVLDVGRGDIGTAIELAGILLALAFIVNGVLTWAQQSGRRG